MTKEELFKKYNINESHNIWENKIDNWMSIEIYRIMHNGNLPPKKDMSTKWVCDFLDKRHDIEWWKKNVMKFEYWGSLFLTAKRLICTMSDEILKEINNI